MLPTSSVLLIAANLVPVVGVARGGWNIFDILFIYWAESAIIGVFNVLKMLTANEKDGPPFIVSFILKLILCVFFTVHFGGFMAAHGAFLYFISEEMTKIPIDPINLLRSTGFALVSLLISHGYSFFANYLVGGEREKASADQLMMQPYARIFVMHLTIIFGMMATMIFGQAQAMLLVFVALKTGVDLYSHMRERKKFKPEAL